MGRMLSPRLIAYVLPPKEGFGPNRTGAVGIKVHRFALALRDGGEPALEPLVIGVPQPQPLYPDVRFLSTTGPWWRLGSRTLRYAAGVTRIIAAEKPALVQVYNRAEIARYLIRAFPKLPVILALGNDPQDMLAAKTPAERAWLLHHAACVVANAAYLADRMAEGVAADQMRRPPEVVPNGIDFVTLPPALPPEARDRTILFVGRVTRDKGADTFVSACARALPTLPGWRAEMIGADRFQPDSPETEFTRALRPQAEAAGVAMLGYKDNADVLAALSRAAIVVMPSRWNEPFGMTAVEAMACGAALITARRGGLPQTVGDAAVFADPDDPADLAAAVTALAKDAARRAQVSAACRALAAIYDVRRTGAQFNALIRSILADW